jgi:mitotic spindle assembly checkpoint protein MAD1
MARLQSEHSQLSSKYSQLMTNSNSEIQLLTQRLKEVEADRDGLKNWERRAKGLSIELEEERRKAAEGRTEMEDSKEDNRREEVMRNELKRELV